MLPRNYLSKNFQLKEVDKIQKIKDTALRQYDEEKQNRNHRLIYRPPTTKDATSFALAIENFQFLIDNVKKDISEEEKGTDNTILLTHCEGMIVILKQYKNELERPNSYCGPIMETMILELNKTKERLKTAVDIHIHEVRIPIETYRSEFEPQSKVLFSDGSHPAAVYSKCASTPIIYLGGVITLIAFCPGVSRAILDFSGDARYEFRNRGYAFKQTSLLPEWIVAGDSKVSQNDESYKTLFFVDGQNPEKIRAQGLHYISLSFNPHGHMIGFDDRDGANHFIEKRGNGATFDPAGGWRMRHAWTLGEKQGFSEVEYKIIEENIPLPVALIKIIGGYANFFTPKEKASKRIEETSSYQPTLTI